jgi:molybdopterin-guanine dinucleotide biosynthesis protein A
VIIGKWFADERPPVPVFADAIDDTGSLGGLYTALLVAQGDGTVVIAGDMPFVDSPLLAQLTRPEEDEDAVIPVSAAGTHPLCAWYRRSVAPGVKARLDRGDLRVRDAVSALRVRMLDPRTTTTFDPDGTILMNINTIADYERACQVDRRHA